MGRHKIDLTTKIKNGIKNHGDQYITRTKNNEIKCIKCPKNIEFEEKTIGGRIKDHVGSKTHRDNLKGTTVNQLINDVVDKMNEIDPDQESFNDRFMTALVAADIAPQKIMNPILKKFLEDEMKRTIPHPSTLCRSIERLYRERINKLTMKSLQLPPLSAIQTGSIRKGIFF